MGVVSCPADANTNDKTTANVTFFVAKPSRFTSGLVYLFAFPLLALSLAAKH